jgi:hypothetical protein
MTSQNDCHVLKYKRFQRLSISHNGSIVIEQVSDRCYYAGYLDL